MMILKYSRIPLIISILFFFAVQHSFAEECIIDLWKGVKGMRKADSVMFMTKPKNANGTAVIICPGGSYHHLGMFNEGHCAAKWFNTLGVTTFVLRYRVAESGFHFPCQLQDIQRAVALVRENAGRYGIDTHKIGTIGFSAGGHLVTMAGAFAGTDNELEKLGIHTSVSLRPDFVISVYPVVSMRDDIANKWSRRSLLGSDMSEERKEKFSMEKQIPENMPPTYLAACRDDPVVMFENSVLLDRALTEKNIPHRFAVYNTGGHGFGMLNNAFMKKYHWNKDLEQWLKEYEFLPE
ncbi:MAG: alpha/beta hydrolase [Treponema sp.]|nr:alpha/beta hydrolase [Treponema sp.]